MSSSGWSPPLTYFDQDAQLLGPTQSAKAILARSQSGDYCIGLPLLASQSPTSIPAYHFHEIVTAQGVYAYDTQQNDFLFKSYADLAAEAKVKRDDFWKQGEQHLWDRRVESYKLNTERLKALAPYYYGRWWWWR